MNQLPTHAPTKPDLPEKIETIDQAQDFLKLLRLHGWLYDPDADALMIEFPEVNAPNMREKRQLNKLMDAVCSLESPGNFSPWDYFNELAAK